MSATGALLQRAGLAMPVADTDTIVVRYAAVALMRDLRAMGGDQRAHARRAAPAPRQLRARREIYADRFCDPDGRVRATFAIVWMSGWAPHASQQKPAQRGSRRSRSATLSKAREIIRSS